MTRWMIYGVTGYTGRLVARVAAERGERPVVSGRDAVAVAALAAEYGFEHVAFGLDDTQALHDALADVDAVAHCAGPYDVTAEPMLEACLATRTHYLDITGELPVYESVFARHDRAVEAGIVLLPGAGFDVVPTDCLANLVAAQVSDAVSLELAFLAGGGMSPGTAKTGLLATAAGGRRRADGKLVPTPIGEPSRDVPFALGARRVGAIPWGDLVTASRSTGIPNITTYTRVPTRGAVARVQAAVVSHLLGYGAIRRFAASSITRRVSGPSPDTRSSTNSQVWAEVRNVAGGTWSATLVGPNAYDLTADALVRAIAYVVAGAGPAGPISPGAHTPATALGADFVRELDGVTVSDVRAV